MRLDRYGFQHSTTSIEAVHCFEAATYAVLSHQSAMPAILATLELDADHVGAIALMGLSATLAGTAEPQLRARTFRTRATAALQTASSGTASERALSDALVFAANGQLSKAACRLEAHLADHPTDVLPAKLSHALSFMSGEASSMLATTSSILRHIEPNSPGYGFILGCHAFSLEEAGCLAEAEVAGRTAVEFAPHDVWALHAVAHVLEMEGRAREGINWLEPTRAKWPKSGVFSGHLAWHLALFELEMNKIDVALAIFDAHLSEPTNCDFRDLANASSLLWRIKQEGGDVGDRWERIALLADERRHDTTYVFGTLHALLALVATGRMEAAYEAADALRRAAASPTTDQHFVARDLGIELAVAILALADTDAIRPPLASLAQRLSRLGGSIAQRDVFLRTLLMLAADAGDTKTVASLSAIRLRQRRSDRFMTTVHERIERAGAKSKAELPGIAPWAAAVAADPLLL